MGDSSQGKAQEEKRQAMEEAKHSILAQVLSQDARARREYINVCYMPTAGDW